MTAIPFCTRKRRAACADDFPCLPPILLSIGSAKISFRPSVNDAQDCIFVPWQTIRSFNISLSKLNIVATYDLVYNASLLVEKGIGYVIALDKLINTTGESCLCFRPFYPALDAGLCIIWKKYQVFSRTSNLFLHQLIKYHTA